MFVLREDKKEFKIQKVIVATILSLALFGGLYGIAHIIPTLENHHSGAEEHH